MTSVTRRGFLSMLGLAVASEAIPFNRVWSFPSKIRLATSEECRLIAGVDYDVYHSAAIAQLAQIYYNPKVIAQFNAGIYNVLIEEYCESTQIPS